MLYSICRQLTIAAIPFLAVTLSVAAVRADTIRFLAVNGAHAGGVYVAPYTASLNGSAVDVICLDAERHVNIGDVWNVQIHDIGDPGPDFAMSADSLEEYQTAAVLWTWLQEGTISKAAASYAVWNLFRPGFSLASGGPEALLMQTEARKFVEQHTNLSYAGVSILTPTSHGPQNNQYQEFMTGRVVMTPEPQTLLMAAGGILLLGVAHLGRKSLRR